MKKSRFIVFHFDIKKRFGITMNEYAILELIYLYSTNPSSAHQGWCYASKSHLADCIDVSRRTVIKIINNMQEAGFLDKAMDGRMLRTTSKWNDTKFTGGAESSQVGEVNSLFSGAESSPQTVQKVHPINKESKKEEINKVDDKFIDSVKVIIDYLNLKAGTGFRWSSVSTRKLIQARFKEKFTVEDFKNVIDTMVGNWKGDNQFEQYLRPSTLFGNKFENYLNSKIYKKGNVKSDPAEKYSYD
jgi:uncharacterized phage protein (TIGR02220 family)